MDKVKALEEYVKTLEGLIDERDAGLRYEYTGTYSLDTGVNWVTVPENKLTHITLSAGTWVIGGHLVVPSSATGRRALRLYDATNEQAFSLSDITQNAVAGDAVTRMQTATTVTVTEDTEITLQVAQNSGSEQTVAVGIEAVLIASYGEVPTGGTSSYTDLQNKPQIEGVTLIGNKSFDDFGLVVPTKISDLTNDSDFVEDANYVHTDSNYTSAEKSKLAGIANGAEVNVQSDWNQSNTSADDYIKNKPTVPTKTSDLANDSGFISSETDPVFSASAASGITSSDISNWNNKSDFSGDYDDLTNKPTIPSKTSDLNNDSGYSSVSFTRYTTSGTNIADIEIDGTTTKIYAPTSGGGGVTDYDQLTSRPQINSTTLTGNKTSSDLGLADEVHTHTKSDITDFPTIPSKTSDLNNDSGFITTETDPTVPSWAKASSKPTYTASEVGALPDTTTIPTKTSDLTNDSNFISGTGFFQIVQLAVTTTSVISAHGSYANATYTVPSADRPSGMTLVGIVGWGASNYRLSPSTAFVNGAHSISVTLANTSASSVSSGATVNFRLLYVKATSD